MGEQEVNFENIEDFLNEEKNIKIINTEKNKIDEAISKIKTILPESTNVIPIERSNHLLILKINSTEGNFDLNYFEVNSLFGKSFVDMIESNASYFIYLHKI